MTFSEANNWILSLSNIPRKEYMTDPRQCGWYLDRLQAFLTILGNPEKKIAHYIHVTGTSGKGSTTAFMHGILHAAGYKVGSTYSPHPSKITERWKIGNEYMSEQEFVSIVEYLKPKLDLYIQNTKYDMISFFELTEAIGLLFFVRHKVTHAVMEVACGGRYDSSNVIPHKDLALITNIGLDHVGIIGNNKSEIAYEKAGIITKKTSHALTAEKNTRIARIIEAEAKKHHVPYTRISKPSYTNVQFSKDGISFVYGMTTYTLPVHGVHQIHNAILCIEAAKKLQIDERTIIDGLMHTTQPLRMEVVKMKPLTILDGAHNHDKVRSTVETTRTLLPLFNINNLHLIVGFSADKDIDGMLVHLLSLKPQTIVVTRNTVNPFRKVANMVDLKKKITHILPHTTVGVFLDPREAYEYTKKTARKNDAILATGSIFMSGELRSYILG